jgi:hypothetical protein
MNGADHELNGGNPEQFDRFPAISKDSALAYAGISVCMPPKEG